MAWLRRVVGTEWRMAVTNVDRTVSVLLLRVAAVAGMLMAVWAAMVLLASNASADHKPLPPKPTQPSSGLFGLVGNTLGVAQDRKSVV